MAAPSTGSADARPPAVDGAATRRAARRGAARVPPPRPPSHRGGGGDAPAAAPRPPVTGRHGGPLAGYSGIAAARGDGVAGPRGGETTAEARPRRSATRGRGGGAHGRPVAAGGALRPPRGARRRRAARAVAVVGLLARKGAAGPPPRAAATAGNLPARLRAPLADRLGAGAGWLPAVRAGSVLPGELLGWGTAVDGRLGRRMPCLPLRVSASACHLRRARP